MTTKLGAAIANGSAPQASPASRFMAALSGKRPRRVVTVPELELPGVMTLLGTTRSIEIEGDVQRTMLALGLEPGPMTIIQFELARAVRHLAEAVFEPDERDAAIASSRPLGTVEEWGSLTKEAVTELWAVYCDLCEAHDPATLRLTEAEYNELVDAVQKKSAPRLLYSGARKLAAFLLTTVDPPASSPTPKSGSGEPSPAT